jgi:hypothetical protein
MLSRGFLLVFIALIFLAGIHSTVRANAETPICASSSSPSSSSLSLPCRFTAEEIRLDQLPILLLTGPWNGSQALQDSEGQYYTDNNVDKSDIDDINNNNDNDNNNGNGNIEREIPSVVSSIPFP